MRSMRILEVEPAYYSKYPPLGLLKLGKMEERDWNDVSLVNGLQHVDFIPSKIYITSLFTYSWKAVHEAIEFYHKQFPNVPILVGGIYATLMPNNIKKAFPYAQIHLGLYPEAENLLPAYHLLNQVDKWKNWDRSIVFTSSGINLIGYTEAPHVIRFFNLKRKSSGVSPFLCCASQKL